jgi:hypothetical protein
VLSPALAEALAGLFSRYGAAGAVSDYGWTIYSLPENEFDLG